MSRWHSNGPLEAVRAFLAKHPEFQVRAACALSSHLVLLRLQLDWHLICPQMDRTRELMYTHHSMGYLKRVS